MIWAKSPVGPFLEFGQVEGGDLLGLLNLLLGGLDL